MKKKKRMVMMAVCVLLAAWVLAEGMGRTEIHAAADSGCRHKCRVCAI